MKTGICTNPDQLITSPEQLEYIEATVGGILCPAEGDEAFSACADAARRCPVPVEAANCLFPKSVPTTGPDVDFKQVDNYFRIACERAAHLGIKVLVFGSQGSRNVPKGFDRSRAGQQMADHLFRLGRIAAEYDVTLALEPLARDDCNMINTVEEGAALVRLAGVPNSKLLIDTYHMARNGEDPESIRRAGELIVHVHCAEKTGRGPIGKSGEDQRPFFRALKDIGYNGRVSIEAKWDDLNAELPAALDELNRQIETA